MTGVGLRISEPSTGHYSDITFLLMLGDLTNQPVVSSITVSETGQVLPQNGGNIFVFVGVPVTSPASFTTEPSLPQSPVSFTTEPCTPQSPVSFTTEPCTPQSPVSFTTEPCTPQSPVSFTTEPCTPQSPVSFTTKPSLPQSPVSFTTEPCTPQSPVSFTTKPSLPQSPVSFTTEPCTPQSPVSFTTEPTSSSPITTTTTTASTSHTTVDATTTLSYHPAPSPAPSNTMLVSSFPFGSGCILGRNATQSPVRLSAPLGPMNVTSSTTTYCLLISSNASLVSPTAECAGMDTVRRVDMVVDPTCAQQKPKPITAVTVNGRVPQHILQTIDFNGAEYGVLTIKRIESLFQSLPDDGLSVCLTFNKAAGSRCNSPQALFSGPTIVYQITSIDFMCCPTSEAPES
ncbi:hypothetical protein VOLCADRAFT_90919 [Volvox carteri f. nagariensis]|uniref:Pherophorin domain-containing protein n=1 Tax=Volvox carteri f. nagariensis TaxID=3068 RepID=D8TVQ5_VOLCA|nr:uncharacterized protein VOLCADRAFT_90919 [Volvox carteri f. nagariensis]EFJ48343.1 hypothetical protein VOLCADRAFT_90919 [Volvox carteri f. nagariensis]|eukprot:XP_002950597.1 hypothetical protein VOLCADRAFT_90919 [Volvox carteri f. nagariensis]